MAASGVPATKAEHGRPARPMVSRSSIRGYALFWVLGAAFLWWPWTLLRAIVGRRRGERPPATLILTTGLLASSLALAALFRPDPLRVVAAVANLTVWATLVFWSARRWERSEVDGVLRGIVDLAVIQAVLTVLAFAIYPTLSGFELPLVRILPDSVREEPNIAALSTFRMAYPDYFGRPVLRAAGLFGNATWAGGLAGLALVVLLFGRDRLSPLMQRFSLRWAATVLCAVSLYLCYARVDVLALLGAGAGVWAVRHKRFLVSRVLGGVACISLAALIIVAPNIPVERWFNKLNEPRQGSLVSRSEIYRRTLERVASAPVPLIGAGVKERESGFVASLGSHSTYLGLAYRGGILCAISLLFFLAALLLRSWRQNAAMALALTLYVLIWCATDDIDAANLMPLGLLAALCLAREQQPQAVSDEIQPAIGQLGPSPQ